MAVGTFSPSDAVEFIFGEDAGTHPNFARFTNKPDIHRELIEMMSDPGVSRRILEEPCAAQFNLGVRFYADNTNGDIVRAAGRSARLLKKIYLDAREDEDRMRRVFVDIGQSILHGSCTRLMWECIQRGKARGFSIEVQASPTDIDLSVIKNGMKFRDVRAFNESFAKHSVGLRAIEEAGEGGVPFVIVVVRSNVGRVVTVVNSFKGDELTSKVLIKTNPGQKGSFCWRCFKCDIAKCARGAASRATAVRSASLRTGPGTGRAARGNRTISSLTSPKALHLSNHLKTTSSQIPVHIQSVHHGFVPAHQRHPICHLERHTCGC
jgi:hypothetical protein